MALGVLPLSGGWLVNGIPATHRRLNYAPEGVALVDLDCASRVAGDASTTIYGDAAYIKNNDVNIAPGETVYFALARTVDAQGFGTSFYAAGDNAVIVSVYQAGAYLPVPSALRDPVASVGRSRQVVFAARAPEVVGDPLSVVRYCCEFDTPHSWVARDSLAGGGAVSAVAQSPPEPVTATDPNVGKAGGAVVLSDSRFGVVAIPGEFMADGLDATLRVVSFYSDGRVRVAINPQPDGDDFTGAVEQALRIVATSGSHTLEITGGTGGDTTEFYEWTPGNAAEVTAFYNAVDAGDSVTVRLDPLGDVGDDGDVRVVERHLRMAQGRRRVGGVGTVRRRRRERDPRRRRRSRRRPRHRRRLRAGGGQRRNPRLAELRHRRVARTGPHRRHDRHDPRRDHAAARPVDADRDGNAERLGIRRVAPHRRERVLEPAAFCRQLLLPFVLHLLPVGRIRRPSRP